MAKKFEFVEVSGDDLKGDELTRRRVRSHAQADYRRRNPAPPRPPLKAEVDISRLFSLAHAQEVPGPVISSSNVELDTSDQLHLPVGTDVISLLPDGEQPRARLLWDHYVGFIDMIRGSGALMQMLSTSAYHISNRELQGGTETIESARYSVVATRVLRERLGAHHSRADMETVIAILAFAAFAALGHRDGLASIETMPSVRIMIYWIDLGSALLQDTLPRYPQPFQILSTYSQVKLSQSAIDRSPACENLHLDPSVSRILEGLRRMNAVIETQHAKRGDELWKSTLFPLLNVSPVLHDLMSMSRGAVGEPIEARRRECFRLAAILYVIEMRQKFGVDPAPADLYSTKLKMLLDSPDILPTWGGSDDILLWTLTVAASATCVASSLRAACNKMLQECLEYASSTHSYEGFAFIANNMWSYSALGPITVLEQLSSS